MLAAAAAVAVIAVDALYLAIINSQGGIPSDTPLVAPFVAVYLALMAVLLAASVFAPPAAQPALRAAPAAGLFLLGVLALFSIGIAILITALLAGVSTVLSIRARPGARSPVSASIAALIAVALLVGGFEFTWNYLVCPSSGESGGSTASFLGHGSSYVCQGGVLTVRR